MRARVRTLRLRDVALFAVVTALVAVGGVFAARWAGLDGVPVAATEEPLTLKLSATQQICETDHAARISGGESWKDEDGTWHEKLTVYGWGRVPTVPVRWQVSGGQAPYTLVIDHESRDQHREDYSGAKGTAFVGCADASVGTSFWWREQGRLYDADPMVDSGWKTVNAVVTDANGDTAQASTEFYVLLDLGGGSTGDVLRRGETYRILGTLMTAPTQFDVVVGGVAEGECEDEEENPTAAPCHGRSHGFYLDGTDSRIELSDEGEFIRRRVGIADNVRGTSDDDLWSVVNEWVATLGQLPQRRASE